MSNGNGSRLTVVRYEIPPPPGISPDDSHVNQLLYRKMADVRRHMREDDYKRAPELVVNSEHMAHWLHQWITRHAPDLVALVIIVDPVRMPNPSGIGESYWEPPKPGFAKTQGFMDGERQYTEHDPNRVEKELQHDPGPRPSALQEEGLREESLPPPDGPERTEGSDL